jgi:hypothetical protein
MATQTKAEILRDIIQSVANEHPLFFNVKGAGAGDKDTNAFMRGVRRRALTAFGADFSEKRICGDSAHAVDFYFEDDATIVEIALRLENPASEFEKDILKALLAQDENYPVTRLIFICKPGGLAVCNSPGRTAFRQWALQNHQLKIDIYEIDNNHFQTE